MVQTLPSPKGNVFTYQERLGVLTVPKRGGRERERDTNTVYNIYIIYVYIEHTYNMYMYVYTYINMDIVWPLLVPLGSR